MALLSPQNWPADQSEFGSSEFFQELARLDGIAKQISKPKAGTLGMLVTEYRASSEFSGLAPRTRTDYQRIFDYVKPHFRNAASTI